MTTRSGVVAMIVIVLGGCVGGDTDPLRVMATPQPEAMPADIGADCDLAARRCTRCHTIDRVLNARIGEPDEWRRYVHRMRLMPSSAIAPDEEFPIAKCLVFRTSGHTGLAQLGAP
jgi:hypothetical protein